MSAAKVLAALDFASGEMPVSLVSQAPDPLQMIENIIKAEGRNGVYYSTALKNDLYMAKNALKRYEKKKKEAVNKAIWKLWEQLKIPEEDAVKIVARCERNGFALIGLTHILYKTTDAGFRLADRNKVRLQEIF